MPPFYRYRNLIYLDISIFFHFLLYFSAETWLRILLNKCINTCLGINDKFYVNLNNYYLGTHASFDSNNDISILVWRTSTEQCCVTSKCVYCSRISDFLFILQFIQIQSIQNKMKWEWPKLKKYFLWLLADPKHFILIKNKEVSFFCDFY